MPTKSSGKANHAGYPTCHPESLHLLMAQKDNQRFFKM
jgi:hypothetical protein